MLTKTGAGLRARVVPLAFERLCVDRILGADRAKQKVGGLDNRCVVADESRVSLDRQRLVGNDSVSGEDRQAIAKQCGTSVEMLERNYSFAIEDLEDEGPKPVEQERQYARQLALVTANHRQLRVA
jgi:hypothetical protein